MHEPWLLAPVSPYTPPPLVLFPPPQPTLICRAGFRYQSAIRRCGSIGNEVSSGSQSGGPDTTGTTCGLSCKRPRRGQMYTAVTLLTESNPASPAHRHRHRRDQSLPCEAPWHCQCFQFSNQQETITFTLQEVKR